MIYEAREPLSTSARHQKFNFAFNYWWHHVFLPQGEAAQNHGRYRDNRAGQQRPHEKTAPREKPDDRIHGSRDFGKYPSSAH
jgi:hypothetical protein